MSPPPGFDLRTFHPVARRASKSDGTPNCSLQYVGLRWSTRSLQESRGIRAQFVPRQFFDKGKHVNGKSPFTSHVTNFNSFKTSSSPQTYEQHTAVPNFEKITPLVDYYMKLIFIAINLCIQSTRWFKYDWDKLWLVYTQIVPVIFEPPCSYIIKFYGKCIDLGTIFITNDTQTFPNVKQTQNS
jgi:hypothetical protein